MDPKTGKLSINNTDGKYDPVLGSPSVYATDTQDYVMELEILKLSIGIEYIAANMKTGKVSQVPWCGETETANYDLQSKSIYGIGLIADPKEGLSEHWFKSKAMRVVAQ